MLLNVLELWDLFNTFHLHYHIFRHPFRPIHSLIDSAVLCHYLRDRLLPHPLPHLDLRHFFLLLFHNSFHLLLTLHPPPHLLPLHLLLSHDCSFDHLFEWFEYFLLRLDFLDLPTCVFPRFVLVFGMQVAVLVTMLFIGFFFWRAAIASVKLAAGFLGQIRPISSILVVAAATAPSSFASPLALALGSRGHCFALAPSKTV